MVRLVKETEKDFTVIANETIRDSRLSWKARGIFAYMWSQANDWDFYVSELVKHAPEGREALQSGLKELEHYGYLTRRARQSDNGKMNGTEWVLVDHQPENTADGETSNNAQKSADYPFDGNTIQRETSPAENPRLRNTNNKKYQQQEILTARKQEQTTTKNELLEQNFEKLWQKYPNKVGKRAAFNHYKAWKKKSKDHTDEYLAKKLDEYIQYVEQRRRTNFPDLHYMNGSTWFNGRFDDELSIDDNHNSNDGDFGSAAPGWTV